jgi:hypothetical protein
MGEIFGAVLDGIVSYARDLRRPVAARHPCAEDHRGGAVGGIAMLGACVEGGHAMHPISRMVRDDARGEIDLVTVGEHAVSAERRYPRRTCLASERKKA